MTSVRSLKIFLLFDKTYGIANGDSIPKSTFYTEDAVKKVFNSINDGAMVNFTWKSGTSYAGGNHSVIVTSITSFGISVCHSDDYVLF